MPALPPQPAAHGNPFRSANQGAASATESLAVIGIGVAITLPVIVIYTIFMYRVFWGKARELAYGL